MLSFYLCEMRRTGHGDPRPTMVCNAVGIMNYSKNYNYSSHYEL